MLDILIALGKAIGLFVGVTTGIVLFGGWLYLMFHERYGTYVLTISVIVMVLGTAVGFYFSP